MRAIGSMTKKYLFLLMVGLAVAMLSIRGLRWGR